jgi:hypothetical protein
MSRSGRPARFSLDKMSWVSRSQVNVVVVVVLWLMWGKNGISVTHELREMWIQTVRLDHVLISRYK